MVEAAIKAHRTLDGSDYAGDPIASAFEAFVTTRLHLRCIELLFAAGVPASLEQFNSYFAESTGSQTDDAMYAVLHKYAAQSQDPRVRANALAIRPHQ